MKPPSTDPITSAATWRRYSAAVVAVALLLAGLAAVPAMGAAGAQRTAPAKVAGAPDRGVQPPGKTAAKVLAGRYIVELDGGVSPREIAADYRGTVKVRQRYSKALVGFAAAMSASAAEALRQDERVLSVEPDVELTLSSTQSSPPWGLDRMDQRRKPLDDTYTYDREARGVAIYIVDSGVYRNHNQFGDRVRRGYDATGEGSTDDCVGHGTHVAGTAAGNTFGVAKRAKIIPVRVLDCSGSGTKSMLIAGLEWLIRDHQRSEPAVANLSLGGPASRVVDRVVNRVLDDGVTVVAAAGNEGDTWWGNACDYSPARVGGAITVGAVNRYDEAPLWSNYGPCLDLFAPGADIKSAAIWYRSASTTESGTSMAAPFVSGAAAVFLSNHRSAGPRRVAEALRSRATPGIVAYAGPNTTEKLLFVPGRVPTRIGISLSDGRVALGEETSVRATLRNAASDRPIAGKTLKVYRRYAGTTAWHHLGNRTTNSEGKITLDHAPARPTQYRVKHARTATTRSDTSDTVKVGVSDRAQTILSLAVDTGTITYRQAAPVSGVLRRSHDGTRLRDKRVELQARPAGNSGWSFVDARRTDVNGAVDFFQAPKRNTDYRLAYGGNDRLLATASASRRLGVRFAISAQLSSTEATVGDTVDLTGRVQPVAKDPDDRYVRIKYREPGDWYWWSYKVWYDDAGSFRKRVIRDWYWWSGIYRFRVRAPGDGANVETITDVLTVDLND